MGKHVNTVLSGSKHSGTAHRLPSGESFQGNVTCQLSKPSTGGALGLWGEHRVAHVGVLLVQRQLTACQEAFSSLPRHVASACGQPLVLCLKLPA